jgi:tripartite-type tricarboxylate transporter receptor subunit TctC
MLAPANAQETYPSRPIRLIIPFPAGGPTDVFARLYAQRMSAILGKQVVPDNRPGAAGAIGSTEAARAQGNGYTMVFGTASTHGLYNLMSKHPQYDSVKDFAHVAIVGAAPATIVVHPTRPSDLRAFVALVKANPGKLQYGSPGTGTFLHLAAEMFKIEAGNLDIPHIPYRGSAPAMNDLLGNQIGMIVDTLGTSLEQHREGKVRILALASRMRSPLAPEIPTVSEGRGIENFEAALWNVVAVPVATPAQIVTTLHAATMKVMAEPALQERLRALGIEPTTDSTPAAAREFLEKERERFKPVVQATGASID